jgi:hypothetical protein
LIQERKKRKRVIRAIDASLVDVLMKVEGSDKLVPAFSDGGCIGLNTCPENFRELVLL